MRVTVFDYGAGNLHSLLKAIEAPDSRARVESDPAACTDTDMLVLPGVGAFTQAAQRLAPAREAIRERVGAGLPVIGICLGMQLLFAESEEGPGQGLGVLAGRVTRLRARRVPHIGWNTIEPAGDPLLAARPIREAYYANGFACRPADPAVVTAWSTHESDRFPAIVRSGNVLGVQFHPEKSSQQGVRFLRAALGALVAGAPAEGIA